MNKLAVITAFLGGQKNRYMQYEPNRNLEEKMAIAAGIENLDGLELCYPADFQDLPLLKRLLGDSGFGVSGVNFRSRRDGRWLRGSFSSADSSERSEVVDDFKRAIDSAGEVGCTRMSTCPLNDGHDYVFEVDYFDMYRFAEETFAAICAHNPKVRIGIEYKWNDARARCLFGSAAEIVAFCDSVGADNLGATLDIGHSLLAHERPAQAVALLHRAERLFYVHLNDNDRYWDWDMLPGAYNLWEFVEFLYALKKAGYDSDWYAFDVASKEIDTTEFFTAVTHMTRRLEMLTDRLDSQRIDELARDRNPAKSLLYLFDTLLPEG